MSRPEQKKKLAIYTATGCRACEQGILDLNYEVNELGRFADPVFWPYVLGTPWEALGEGKVDVALFAGTIRTEADRQAALLVAPRATLLGLDERLVRLVGGDLLEGRPRLEAAARGGRLVAPDGHR